MTATYLTREEAAEVLRCSPRFVSHLISSGALVGSRVGRHLLINCAALDEYVASQAVVKASSPRRRRQRRAVA